MKICSVCRINKELNEFVKDRGSKDGRSSRCLECKRVLYQQNRDKILEKLRQHYLENRELLVAKTRNWRQANPEKAKEVSRKSHKRNADRHNAYRREKRRKNPLFGQHKPNPDIYKFDSDGILIKKRCGTCKKTQDISDFPRSSRAKFGLASRCKKCTHIQYKTVTKEYRKAIRDKKIDKERERTRKWRLENPLKYLEGKKRWRIANPLKRTEYDQRHKSKRKNVLATLDDEQWGWLLEMCGHQCLVDSDYHRGVISLDHIVPRDPGTHTLDNVQPICMYHNESKGRKTIDYRPDWLKSAVRNKMLELGLETTYL